MQKEKSIRKWEKIKRKNKYCNLTELKEKIKTCKKTRQGLHRNKILDFLKCAPSFIGCFAEDELEGLSIQSFPSYLIVNVDQSNMSGSHWIAIGIFRDTIEIFDSLGLQLFNWSRIPCQLLSFLHYFAQSRDVISLKRIQSDTSTLCGFYCILYVVYRPFSTFSRLQKLFGPKFSANDSILIKFFS